MQDLPSIALGELHDSGVTSYDPGAQDCKITDQVNKQNNRLGYLLSRKRFSESAEHFALFLDSQLLPSLFADTLLPKQVLVLKNQRF